MEGDAGGVQDAQGALERAAEGVRQQSDAQREAAETLLGGWQSKAIDGFKQQVEKLTTDLATTAEASAEAAKIAGEVSQALGGRHDTVGGLIGDFVEKSTQFLGAGLAAVGLNAPGGLMQAAAQLSDLAGGFIKDSGGELKGAQDEMERAAQKLRELQQRLDGDGIADPPKEQETDGPGEDRGDAGQDKPGSKTEDILARARENLGFEEGPNDKNKWGPDGQPWCSYFATSMWQEAGVDIGSLGYSGDVYKWGQEHGTAYDQDSLAESAKPGDALLFGTGPDQMQSTHIGIIEKVEGNQITTIEGNSSDKVQRMTYTLPDDADKFYGGVHPE
nr:CHAP domain-containing protein [Saccharopolyspora gloriosae]